MIKGSCKPVPNLQSGENLFVLIVTGSHVSQTVVCQCMLVFFLLLTDKPAKLFPYLTIFWKYV